MAGGGRPWAVGHMRQLLNDMFSTRMVKVTLPFRAVFLQPGGFTGEFRYST